MCAVFHNKNIDWRSVSPTVLNWRFNSPFVGPPEMTFGAIKGGKLYNVITHNTIWAIQKSVFYLFRWLGAHAVFDITCFFLICWNIRRQRKCSVDTLVAPIRLTSHWLLPHKRQMWGTTEHVHNLVNINKCGELSINDT